MRKLAVLGPKGTYSDLASAKLNREYEIAYYPNILEVIHQVDENTDALIPFENTLDGFVMEALDSIIKNKLSIVSQVKLDIDFSFVSYEKRVEDIHEVYVQFKAYGQCQDFILEHHLTPYITQSNMESLASLKKDASCRGAIVPSHIDTKEFPLAIKNLIGSIHNETRFVLVQREGMGREDSFLNCSIVITPKMDKPGLLYTILSRFSKAGINLKAILSRPRRDLIGKYVFYLEVELEKTDIPLLKNIQKNIEEKDNCLFCLLGIYNVL